MIRLEMTLYYLLLSRACGQHVDEPLKDQLDRVPDTRFYRTQSLPLKTVDEEEFCTEILVLWKVSSLINTEVWGTLRYGTHSTPDPPVRRRPAPLDDLVATRYDTCSHRDPRTHPRPPASRHASDCDCCNAQRQRRHRVQRQTALSRCWAGCGTDRSTAFR